MRARRPWMLCLLALVAGCAAPSTPAPDVPDALDGASFDAIAPADARDAREQHRVDAPAPPRTDSGVSPRCYGVDGPAGLLRQVASIPRESWSFSNGASGCVGDVDNDGTREFVLLRMNEPSELIGADFCSRGRVLLPDYARDCVIADVDGVAGNELVVLSNVAWTRESAISIGAVRRAVTSDDTLERYVFSRAALLDERRHVSPVGAPHLAITDLDRDGQRELAASGNFPASFARVWERSASEWAPVFAQDLVTVMDDSHGWIVGDVDRDGDDEAILLSNCGASGRHVFRTFQRWDSAASADTLVRGPVHGALADLDGVAGNELVLVDRLHCQPQTGSPATGIEVRRYDAMTAQWTTVAARSATGAPSELRYVAPMDLGGTPAHEFIVCSSPLGGTSFPRACAAFALSESEPRTIEPYPSSSDPFTWSSPVRRVILSSILVDDLDGDGAKELFLMGQDQVDVLRGPRR
ncbi:MAG: hypothetical protein JNK05_40305 [Myxococcales bacterium]|nr:hypothetical protein [Myxococcales bacterium]